MVSSSLRRGRSSSSANVNIGGARLPGGMKEDAGHIRDEAAGERRAGGSARPYHPREAVPGIRQSIRQEVEDMLWETRARAKDHDSRQELEKEQRGLQILSGHPTNKKSHVP